MNITIQASGIALTDELYTYTMAKMEDTLRVFGKMNRDAIRMDIQLSRHQEGALVFRAKANISLPGDHFFIEEEALDSRSAVVQLKQKVMERMRRRHEKIIEKN